MITDSCRPPAHPSQSGGGPPSLSEPEKLSPLLPQAEATRTQEEPQTPEPFVLVPRVDPCLIPMFLSASLSEDYFFWPGAHLLVDFLLCDFPSPLLPPGSFLDP